MATANDVLAVARGEIGVTEYPPGSNNVKYNTEYYGRQVYGDDAYPWCMVFVWWVFKHAGASSLFFDGAKTASCPTYYRWASKTGRWYTSGYSAYWNYRPSGTISQPTTTVNLNTTTVNSITNVGSLASCTLPTLTTSVANEVLTLSWTAGSYTAGTLPTKGSDTTVATGVQSVTTTQPTFTGTKVYVKNVFDGDSLTSTGSFTPSGTVSQPTFSGSSLTSTGTYTPAGTVSKPSFTGTAATITVEPDPQS